MTTKTWNFTLDGQPHTLTLKHGILSGKRTILLDGQLLEHIPQHFLLNLINSASSHEYRLGNHSLTVVIQSKFASFAYDLLVDGVSLTTGQHGPQRVMNSALQGTLFFCVLIVGFGCFLSWGAKSGYERRLAIQEWPDVTGTVTGLDTSYHQIRDDDGPDRKFYYPVLDIEYVFNDSRYRARLEDQAHEYRTASQALAAHAVGANYRLYVNPAQPQEAQWYFEKLSPTGWIRDALGIMSVSLGVALLLLLLVWSQTRGKARTTGRASRTFAGSKRMKDTRPGGEAAQPPADLSAVNFHPDDQLWLAEGEIPASSHEDSWANLSERAKPMLSPGESVGPIVLLAFLSIFWLVPLGIFLKMAFQPGGLQEGFPGISPLMAIVLLVFVLVWYGGLSIPTRQLIKRLVRGLRARRRFLRGQAQATARILRGRVVKHKEEYGTTYTYHLQLEFNPTMAAVSAGSLQLEAQIGRKLYESLEGNESVMVSYAVEDPHIFVLEGE